MMRYYQHDVTGDICSSATSCPLNHTEVVNYIDPFRRVDGKWDWRLVVRGENRCGPNSGGFDSESEALEDASECLSFMVYNIGGSDVTKMD